MPHPVRILLLTGFLGSGKTTLLQRLIDAFPRTGRLMILMNEFGEIGIDGALIRSDGDLEVLEISKGSIFCVCVKTDFIRGLARIASEIRPDLLIIEATGVANPTDIRKDLDLSIFKGRFLLTEQVCIIDAENFIDTYETFAFLEKQMARATLFVINKTDRADAGRLEEIKAIVRRHHPDPEFIPAVHADIPLQRFLEGVPRSRPGDETEISPESLSRVLDQILQDPFAQRLPPDQIVSAVFAWDGKTHADLRAAAAGFHSGVVRAKGLVTAAGEVHLISVVMGSARITPAGRIDPPKELVNRIALICREEHIEAIRSHPPFAALFRPLPHPA